MFNEIKNHLSNIVIEWLINHTCINASVVYATLFRLSPGEMDCYCDQVKKARKSERR